MPEFRSKPRTITAVQFTDPDTIATQARVYPNADGDWVVYNGLHQSEIKLKLGDYVRIDDYNDNYPIDEGTFNNTYEPIEGDDNATDFKRSSN